MRQLPLTNVDSVSSSESERLLLGVHGVSSQKAGLTPCHCSLFSFLGIVRFKNPKSAMEAMQRFRMSEIVVKDVAITLKMLSPVR